MLSPIIGLFWEDVAAAATEFVGSVPVAGRVRVKGLVLSGGVEGTGNSAHFVQFALGTETPGSQLALDAMEPVFADACQSRAERRRIVIGTFGGPIYIPLGVVLEVNGRRLVGGWLNGHATTAGTFWAGFVVERVD